MIMKRRQEGFTLIELMIVILIIAILVAIAVPVYLAATNSAKRRTCQSNLRTIDSAINAYNGFYDMQPGNGTCAAVLSTTWLKRNPTCPSSAAPATYSLASGNTLTGIPPSVSCPGSISGHSI